MKFYIPIIILTAIILPLILLFTSCSTINLKYDETGYQVGADKVTDITGIKEIEIDWVAGDVSVAYGNEFSVKESGNNITEDLTMRSKVVGDTLYIKYMKSGSVNVKDFKKNLEVTIPSGSSIEDLDVEVTTGNITLSILSLKEIDLECTTGNITLTNVTANEISLEATTGNIQAIQTTSEEFDAETTTGNITITTLTTKEFDVEIITGNLTASDLYATKADIELTTGTALLGLSTKVSGFTMVPKVKSQKITINPSSTAYTVDNGIYTYGDKSLSIEVEIITGDLILNLV